jgi:hypothetical protein
MLGSNHAAKPARLGVSLSDRRRAAYRPSTMKPELGKRMVKAWGCEERNKADAWQNRGRSQSVCLSHYSCCTTRSCARLRAQRTVLLMRGGCGGNGRAMLGRSVVTVCLASLRAAGGTQRAYFVLGSQAWPEKTQCRSCATEANWRQRRRRYSRSSRQAEPCQPRVPRSLPASPHIRRCLGLGRLSTI